MFLVNNTWANQGSENLVSSTLWIKLIQIKLVLLDEDLAESEVAEGFILSNAVVTSPCRGELNVSLKKEVIFGLKKIISKSFSEMKIATVERILHSLY